MRISPKLPLLFVPALVLASLAFSASPAHAASAWWHLTAGSRPAALSTGPGVDESYTVTLAPTTDAFYLTNASGVRVAFAATATHQEVQSALQAEAYGAGNVEVSGGPGDEQPYTVTFVGDLADQGSRDELRGHQRVVLSGGSYIGGPIAVTKAREGENDGELVLTATNVGETSVDGEGTAIAVADKLPPGVRAVGIYGRVGNSFEPMQCKMAPLECTYGGVVAPYRQMEVEIPVVVEGATSGELGEASVSGGGAPSATVKRPVTIGLDPGFGAEDYEMTPEEEGGSTDTQAGSHPFQLTTTIRLNQTGEEEPEALVKDLHFKLPVGLIGNPTVLPQCSLGVFLLYLKGLCPNDTAIGVTAVTVDEAALAGPVVFDEPVFNLEPSHGEPARFGFMAGNVPIFLDTSVRTGEDYGVTVDVDNIPQTAGFLGSVLTFWGVPGDARHDPIRGVRCLGFATGEGEPCTSQGGSNAVPFLEMPTSCTGPLQTSVGADSWAQPGVFGTVDPSEAMAAQDGCNRLQFEPSVSLTPDSQAASTPTGLAVSVHVPQAVSLNPHGLSEADVKNTTVALPAGIAINPSSADGLQACSEEQIGLKDAEQPLCPEASKVGLVKIKTPLLPNPLEGEAYLAAQNANPFGSLVALYVYVEDPVSGVRVKLAGEVVPNPVTGQLTSTFKNTPQLPFETFELHFFGGDRAPLASPAYCGAYTATAAIEPWTQPGEVDSSWTFGIMGGPASFNEPAGSPCPGAHRPFDPSLAGGATNVNAGAFSPFTLTMTRKDGEQNLQSVEAKLPPGLSGVLSSVELCPEPQAQLGECSEGSKIGETTVSVGVGGDPFTVSGGKFYLTGPYNGTGACAVGTSGCAPFGVTFEVPAKAGPFDLERNSQNPGGEDPCDCVIVRGKIEVDPYTAAITITSNPPGTPDAIPTSIEGIPLEIQHVNAITTRGNFQFNPTSCNKMEVTGTIHSSEGATDTIGVPFQVTNCAILKFAPKFAVSTSGKTSRSKGASLNVKLTYPKAPFGSQANIARVKVDLPKQLPSRLTTLQKACTAAQFNTNPAGCPAASFIGHAKAVTPLIPVPLEGPAIFVSHGGEAFPSLIMVLQGYGVTLDLVGSTFISKAGITSSTFKTVPDAPVGSFELNLPEGKFSALAANGNLCKSKLAMPTEFLAQNGAKINESTPISVSGCPPSKTAAQLRAAKLAAALKACHKKKGSKRSSCEKAARKKYKKKK